MGMAIGHMYIGTCVGVCNVAFWLATVTPSDPLGKDLADLVIRAKGG